MRHLRYSSAKKIIAKLNRNYPDLEWSDNDIIEWVGEALGLIGAIGLYEEAVAFIEVKNHQCGLPCGIHQIIQIARNMQYTEEDTVNTGTLPGTVVVEEAEEEKYPVPIDCYGKPITGVELAYYRPYFDLKYEYEAWMNSNAYTQSYVPVRLTENSFFGSLVCNDVEEKPYQNSCEYEYSIVPSAGILRFSFESGQIAMAYRRQPTDDEGYPMIPDHESYEAAMQAYAIFRKMSQRFYSSREGSVSQLQKSEQDWQWYCGQAAAVTMMPSGVDENQNLMDIKQQFLPRQHRYYGFFGKLAQTEVRTYNDPNRFNSLRGYYHVS